MSLWCCQWFRRLLDRTGEKGFSIIAFKDSDYRSFYIQARPFEKEIVREFEQVSPITGDINVPEVRRGDGQLIPLTISQQIPLSYCPRCGVDLNELISKNISEFDNLTECHLPYRD